MNQNLQELIYAGSDILKSVTNAVDRNDYSNLASDIGKVVKSVNIQRRPAANGQGRPVVDVTYRELASAKPKPKYFLQKQVSKTTGIPQMIASGIAGGLLAVSTLSALVGGAIVGAVFCGIGTAACAYSFLRGNRKNTLAERYYQYGNILGSAEYFSISDLAGSVFRTDREVLKDIRGMIKEGFLPRARLDETQTTCMITDNAYQYYLDAIRARDQRKIQERADTITARQLGKEQTSTQKNVQAKEQAKKQIDPETANLSPEVRTILEEGNEYIRFVRYANDIIPDTEEMSNKLYRLENIMNRIFAQVKKEPKSADELYKLMNYYLPTTKKLLTAYIELDKQPAVGDNITKTKLEIDSAMDTINEAFENLLNSLFQDMAWDISSDISVMKTMMAQDGLTESGMYKSKE